MTSPATVSAHLRSILDMATRLEARAIDRAGDAEIPGGEAMVNLAGVGSKAAWLRNVDAREEAGFYDVAEYEDPDELWPAEQILTWWSEDIRKQLGKDYDGWRPTLVSEAKFLLNRDVAEWIWANEVHWDDYAADVGRARTKLENVLREGERAERGAPCLYEECRGARLVRKLEPYRDSNGEKSWRWTKWHCPVKREHEWDEKSYAAMVTAAHEATKFEQVGEQRQEWVSLDLAARKTDRSVHTIRTWVEREGLATLCLIAGRRMPFISLDEVRELSEARSTRKRRAS